jgi:ABC-type multidrug transport system fused ATPase/permease subunit
LHREPSDRKLKTSRVAFSRAFALTGRTTAPPPNIFSIKRQALQAGASSSARYERDAKILLRLIREQSLRHWKSYVVSFGLMAVLATCVTATAYLIGSAVNATTLDRDFHGVLFSCAAIISIFLVKGLCAVRAGYSPNPCPCSHERFISEFAVRQSMHHLSTSHSSETLSRLRTSAEGPAKVIDMTICAAGREGLSIVGLAAVMTYQDPLLSLGCLLSAPIIFVVARS